MDESAHHIANQTLQMPFGDAAGGKLLLKSSALLVQGLPHLKNFDFCFPVQLFCQNFNNKKGGSM